LGFNPDVAAMEERQTLDPTVGIIQQSAQGVEAATIGGLMAISPKLVLLRAKPAQTETLSGEQ